MFSHTNQKFLDYVDLDCEMLGGKRYYTSPNGDKFPSITTVLSVDSENDIEAWRDRVGHDEADRISNRARRRGTMMHDALESYVMNVDPTFSHPLIEFLYTQIKFELDDNLGLVYAVEAPLYSEHLGLAGRGDLIARWKGKPSIIDYKSSENPKEEWMCDGYFKQKAGYAVMWEERTGMPISQLVTIIAVENDTKAQVFINKRDDWIGPLIETKRRWDEKYGELV